LDYTPLETDESVLGKRNGVNTHDFSRGLRNENRKLSANGKNKPKDLSENWVRLDIAAKT